ncbi:MAG: hypothetical protein HFF39_00500 [Lawsonibacter sp.]|nr:hypothetical protein [Lawsonibacter sp.]
MRGRPALDAGVPAAAGAFYLLNRFWLSRTVPGWPGLFLRCWANDILAGAAILCWLNLLLGWGRLGRVRSRMVAAGFLLVCGLVWECAAPLWKPGAVFDLLDLLAYQAGGALVLLADRLLDRRKKQTRCGKGPQRVLAGNGEIQRK